MRIVDQRTRLTSASGGWRFQARVTSSRRGRRRYPRPRCVGGSHGLSPPVGVVCQLRNQLFAEGRRKARTPSRAPAWASWAFRIDSATVFRSARNRPPDGDDVWLSPVMVGPMLGITPSGVLQLAHAGRPPAKRVGARWWPLTARRAARSSACDWSVKRGQQGTQTPLMLAGHQ